MNALVRSSKDYSATHMTAPVKSYKGNSHPLCIQQGGDDVDDKGKHQVKNYKEPRLKPRPVAAAFAEPRSCQDQLPSTKKMFNCNRVWTCSDPK